MQDDNSGSVTKPQGIIATISYFTSEKGNLMVDINEDASPVGSVKRNEGYEMTSFQLDPRKTVFASKPYLKAASRVVKAAKGLETIENNIKKKK